MSRDFFTSPTAYPTFYRTYSHKTEQGRESWEDVVQRNYQGFKQMGGLTDEELENIKNNQLNLTALPSGRWLWVGGGDWLSNQKNFYGAYNCTSLDVIDWKTFGMLMNLAMCGTGTGAVLEPRCITQLPIIRNKLNITIGQPIGVVSPQHRAEFTDVDIELDSGRVYITVGDSREGWVESYQALLELSSREDLPTELNVYILLGNVRPAGEKLKGFGGTANPVKLTELYSRVAKILNKAIGRQLTSVECCLLIDEAAWAVVAGNIRRCLPEDALVHTVKGLVPIRDIQIGDLVQTPLGFRKVTNKFDQGFQNVYELDTNATSPKGTLNHKYAVLTESAEKITWKSIKDLEEGDILLHNKQVIPGKSTSLPPSFAIAKSFVVPNLVPDVAWLIGFTHGNGYVSFGYNKHNNIFGSISWTLNNVESDRTTKILSKLNSAVALFGLTLWKSRQEKTVKSVCLSVRFAEYFHRYIKKDGNPLPLPDFILQGSVDIRCAYLAGLMDSDGLDKSTPLALTTAAHYSFVRQIGSLLSSLGIVSKIKICNSEEQKTRIKYNILIPAFTNWYNDLISPYSVTGNLSQEESPTGFSIPGKITKEQYGEPFIAGQIVTDYREYVPESSNSNILVTFKELSSYDYVQTYDIEVEEAHCFYCDGYLTHNSAGMKQFISTDREAESCKLRLYTQTSDGKWVIDAEREALKMSNHTRIFYYRPSLEECLNSLQLQYHCGEGAMMFAPEMIARANADLLDNRSDKDYFINLICSGEIEGAKNYLQVKAALKDIPLREGELSHRMGRVGLNPCGEIGMKDNLCNLAEVPLNQIDPHDSGQIVSAFTAAAHSVCCLLHHHFDFPRFQYSREVDPIVAVSFTGLFDFFVQLFGVDWLRWWEAGRPKEWNIDKDIINEIPEDIRFFPPMTQDVENIYTLIERKYLTFFRKIVENTVWEYCDRNGIREPNRCTTLQPSGTKSLLTGASPGWHPPKAARFIRRITFSKNDPVALACIDYGYNVVPGQDDRDEDGVLLDDPFDPRVNTWLVEIPTSTIWADMSGVDEIDISKFSALAQLDMLDQVQNYYVTHNTSATVEIRSEEIPAVAQKFYELMKDNRIVSTTVLARMDDKQTFPRLPFEPIDQETYDNLVTGVLNRRKSDNFHELLEKHDYGLLPISEIGPAPCDSDKCLIS